MHAFFVALFLVSASASHDESPEGESKMLVEHSEKTEHHRVGEAGVHESLVHNHAFETRPEKDGRVDAADGKPNVTKPTASFDGSLGEFTNGGQAQGDGWTRCTDRSKLWPECKECIPGLLGPSCLELSAETGKIRGFIDLVAFFWTGGDTAYAYLATHQYQARQRLVAHMLQNMNARRVLDLGPSTNTLELFSNFRTWCPEIIWSADVVLKSESKAHECSSKRPGLHKQFYHVLHSQMTYDEALNTMSSSSKHFDAIVCMGCDPRHGASTHIIESLPRPFTLFLEYPYKLQFNQDEYQQLPHEKPHKVLFTKTWEMEPEEGGTEDFRVHRYLKVVHYPEEAARSGKSPSYPVLFVDGEVSEDAERAVVPTAREEAETVPHWLPSLMDICNASMVLVSVLICILVGCYSGCVVATVRGLAKA